MSGAVNSAEREAKPERPERLGVTDPATGRHLADVPNLGPDQVKAAVQRARVAQDQWVELGFAGRGDILRSGRRWLIEHSEQVIETIVDETGKAYEDAQLAELAYGAAALGFWAKRACDYLADERVPTHSPFLIGKRLRVRYRPRGVIGVIGPWNFPLTNSFGDCVPALAAGNSVILKPSEETPLTSRLMERMLRECGIPDGVFQVLTGGAETGSAVIDEVDMVMFTGSPETGRRVYERAARSLTPVSLELGGKDPMIVLDDADLERAANTAVHAGMMNAGQICISVERLYVEDGVYNEFVARVVEKVKRLRQGPPGGPAEIDVGATTTAAQLEIIDAHVRDARERGAQILTGGRRKPGPGLYYEPTVLADVDHTMLCMREETFGPTLPIMRVHSADEAVRLANDSPYGLGASVHSGNPARGRELAQRIETGFCCVNDAMTNYLALEAPMGGLKSSGIGVRHGPEGIRKYCTRQTLLVSRSPLRREPHMVPYRARRTRLLGRLISLLYGHRGRQ